MWKLPLHCLQCLTSGPEPLYAVHSSWLPSLLSCLWMLRVHYNAFMEVKWMCVVDCQMYYRKISSGWACTCYGMDAKNFTLFPRFQHTLISISSNYAEKDLSNYFYQAGTAFYVCSLPCHVTQGSFLPSQYCWESWVKRRTSSHVGPIGSEHIHCTLARSELLASSFKNSYYFQLMMHFDRCN